MSKLSQLKQKAYQAGKDRNWVLAISVYEQILEVEKSNPTVINELGDLCLKAGDARKAVKHFLSAATKYRKTGLLNNSVAICKKILRHEATNMHAHWYLAEIRSSQDLAVEGETHALAFLESGERAGSEIQEIFHKRCGKLLELYPASLPILERLMQVFRTWEMTLEASRAGCLKACVIYDAGNKEEAQAVLDDLLVTSPELRNYPEYGKWNKRINPEENVPGPLSEHNSVSLAGAEPDGAAAAETPVEPAAETEVPVAGSGEISFAEIKIDIPDISGNISGDIPVDIPVNVPVDVPEGVAEDPVAGETKDEDGCLVIDTDDSSDMADLIAQATKDVDLSGEPDAPADEIVTEAAPEVKADQPVDLLSQILSEDSGDLIAHDSNQVDTIAAEIGKVVGGGEGDDDADRLYEMGMVYLEMGLFDKASESFETAAADDDYAIRAHEMWGITLQRAGKPDEAITILTAGLQFAESDSRENLGLRYHIGRAHELANRAETAVQIYEEIHGVAPNFLDISTRLSQLAGV